eukprot:3185899-Prymnesium_polylepis.1
MSSALSAATAAPMCAATVSRRPPAARCRQQPSLHFFGHTPPLKQHFLAEMFAEIYLTTGTQEGTTAPSGQPAHTMVFPGPVCSERKFCWSASGIEPRTFALQ